MKLLKPSIILMFLVFILTACTATLSTDDIELGAAIETTQPQQTTEPAPAEPTPSPEPTFQGQYESGAVEVLETDRDLVVAECQSVTAAFDQRAFGTGWVQIVTPRILYIT